VVQYDPSSVVARKIEAGEVFDVVITGAQPLDGLIKRGIAAPDVAAVVGVNAASLAYRHGSPKPDIATADALKALLLGAQVISFSDPAAGGGSSNYFVGVLRQIGIADEILRKAILTRPGEGAVPVADGRADFGAAQTSEIVRVGGVQGVPIFPSDPKSQSTYAAGVSAKCGAPEAARALVQFLQSTEALVIRKAKGLARG
jgi:molybdate transport system substrate-binding protein